MDVGSTADRFDRQLRELDEQQAELHRITMLQLRRNRAGLERPHRELRLVGSGIVVGALAATLAILACKTAVGLSNVLAPAHVAAAACGRAGGAAPGR